MKNSNLLNRLLSYSHEKQSPQRFGRYAAMLIMLLTLGVGQMWGGQYNMNWQGKVYFRAPDNWDLSTYSHVQVAVARTTSTSTSTYIAYIGKMTRVGTTRLYYCSVNNNHNGWNQNEYVFFSANSSDYGDGTFNVNGNHYYTTPKDYGFNNSSNYYYCNPTSEGNGAAFDVTYDSSRDKVVKFTQTVNLYTNGSSSYAGGTVTIAGTYFTGDNSVGTSSVTNSSSTSASYGNAVGANVSLTATPATGYQFDGWYTAGTGGSLESNSNPYSYTCKGTKTVYARFSEKTYSLTFSHNGHGTIKVGGTTIASGSTANVNYFTTKTLVATPSTGYDFDGWTKSGSNTGSVTIGNEANASTTIKATNTGATVTAGFTAHDYTITYNNMTGATNHASNPSSYTIESAAITLYTPTKVGYMFDGWYTDAELTTPVGTPAIAAGSTGNKVFYAKWTEITLTEVSASPSTGGTGVQTMTVSFKTNVPRNSGYYYRVVEFGGVDAGTTGGGFHSNGNLISTGDAATLITSASFSTINFATSGVYTSAIEIYTDGPVTVQKRVTFTYGAGNYYTVSFNMQGHGSDIDDQLIASGSKATEPDEPSETGYTFGGWYKEAACTNAWNFASDAVTSDKTLFAKWTANQYTITFDKEGGSGGSDNVTVYYDATLGAFSSAPTRTGYTFAGYWTGDNGTGTKLFAANGAPQASVGSYTDGSVKWIYAGNPTVYAKWTENTVTLTPSVSYDHGSSNYTASASNSGTVGVTTTTNLSCSAPNAAHYTFAGWTLSSNLVVTSGNAATDRTITVRTNGDGNAVSATANYNEVLTSRWHLVGANVASKVTFPDGWNVTNTSMMQKASGHSTESVVYGEATVSNASGTYEFKVVDDNGASSDIWYGYSTGGTYLTWTGTATKTVYSGDGNANNLKFTPTVAGTYTFKVDYSGTYPTVTITYPVSYTLTYSVGSVSGNNGSISTSPSTSSGSKVISGTNITLTAPAAKTGYTWSGWFTNAAGTEGQIADEDRAITVTMNADKTLYACYTENTYNVSASATPAGYGTVTPTSSTSMGQINGGNITASPNAGYSFSGWSIASGSGYFGASGTATTSATANTKFRPTANATLTGTFAEVLRTVTVAVNNSYLGSVSTTSLSDVGPVTKSAEVTATPETGASFTRWDVESGITIADGYTNTSNPVKINATAASKTLTAVFTETKYTVTLSTADADKGTVGSNQSVGRITAVQITATPKSGYMFSKWVKTAGSGTVTYYTGPGNGQVTDASGEEKETTYICVTGNVTLQATWEPDRSSGYVVHYGNSGKNADGGDDASQTRPWKDGKLYRATTAASDVSYFSFTAGVGDVDKVIYFKIWDGGSNWYGYNSASGGKFSSDITDVTLNTSYGDARMCIIMPGTYKFTWNKSTKKLSVAYPDDVYYLRGGFNSWNWAYPMTEVRTGVYAATINLTEANHTYEANTSAGFKVLIAGKYYGKNGTTVTRANSTGSADISGCNTSGNNFGLTTDFTGNYTFEYTVASNTLKVIYPTAYTVTYGVGTGYSSMGSVSTSPSVTSGNYVRAGSEIAFTATPNLGYKFVGWYREAACANQVSTDNPYEPTINAKTTLYAKFAYRDLYIQADWLSWGTAQMTQSTVNRAIYTYEIDNVAAAATSATAPYNNGYHFRIMNANNGGDGYLAYTYNDVQTPTGSGFLSNSDIHLTAPVNPTIQYNLTHKSKITITLTLQSVDDATKPTVNIAADRYYDINYTAPSHGSYTIQVGVAGAVSANTEARAGTTITLTNTPSTGYSFGSWTVAKSAGTVTVSNNQFTMPAEDVTVSASFTANTYKVRFERNGGTGGDNMEDQTFTYDAAQNLTECSYTKTGYNFAGWALAADAAVTYADEASVSNLTSTNSGIFYLYAKWTPMSCTVEFDFDESDAGFGNKTGATTDVTATYDAAMTSVTPPTAANGYAFMGYYDDADGEGTQYYNADGTSAHAWDKEDAEATLYAYFKQAEITNLVAAPGVIAPGETITITPTIEPTPTGTTKVCYELQYSNGTPLPSQPTFTPGVGNAVSFPVPSASATYIIQATLAKGSSCPADPGDVLSTRTTTFQVAGEHTVTIRYQDSDGRTLQASASIEARPLTWTTAGDITPPTITGYKFDHWDAGDGVTIKNGESDPVTTSTTSSIQIQAVYDGTLTAVYSKKRMIYFNNTLGWSSVYVYFYKNDSYWETAGDKRGSGANTTYTWTNTPYSEGKHGQMLPVSEGSNIYYFDAEAEGVNASYDDVVFTEHQQHGYNYFYQTNAVRRGDYKTSLPMFVPINGQTAEVHNKTNYYNEGYWMNYPENTGYVLHVYAGTGYGTSDQLQEIPFEFTEDKTLPMSVNVELNASRTYGFEIHRADGTKLGENEYTLVSGNSGDEGQTVRTLGESERSKITTTVAGDYTFKLNYGKVSSEYYYLIGVHYPVVVGDYRILYTDDATWSKGAHAPEYVWSHDSRTIHKENGATDIVSFYVKYDSDTKMKFQKVNSITANTGAVSWADSVGGTIDISSIKKDGVYNFYLSQANGVIRVDSIRPYTGKYYIRTDCAGATKWENFRTSDHEMTYSEYTETKHGYSHYYPHWVAATKNVKFCIANDYSPSITDTLVEDYGTVIANIDAGGYLQNYGANIRFMWNQSTNKIWRAYIGGSSNITDRFLVLEGDAKMFDEAGNALTGVNQDHRIQGEVDTYLGTDNQVILYDDENFVYERTIQVNTGARAKLTAKYNNNVQYFRGSEGAFADGTTVELLGGEASGKHTMRIVYDFKTNRLVTAYVPSGTIEDDIAINADLMIVRNHQEAGQQLLFNGGSLSEVHTVYGVMRFNRWTLNNKETTGSHDPVGDPKSAYERALYWISFPFNVNLSDVFGFGTYGTHWIIMEYDGAERAQKGYWADSKGFWKYVTNRTNKVLEAGKGYVLALDLDLMKYNDATFWTNNIEQVELFFPSAAEVNNISETNVQTTVDSHECTIDRTGNNGSDINKNRTKADSHWNMIGIPSYANYGTTLKDGAGGSTITWNSNPYTNDLPFLYEWNMVDNTYTVQSGTTYPFKSMHAYMVQYHGNLYWSLASATPVSPIVARRTYAEKPQNVELRLELSQNEMKVDQTFVKLSNDENASTKFAFDEDLCKEYNANKANIYTFIEGYIPAGGNTLPMTEQTMVVPVGVQIAANGDYTFAIPEGTEGIGITLIDNETGIRTSLSALDYTINLNAGTYNDRFVLEISPVHQSPTGIELLNGENGENGVRKVLIDNILYIVKDGVMYDARGSRVQ